MTSAQDRKRLRPCSGSDTSVDGDSSYLDLNTGGVIKIKSTKLKLWSLGSKRESNLLATNMISFKLKEILIE